MRSFVTACLLAGVLSAFPFFMSGRVLRVDYANAVVLVRTRGGVRTVWVTPSTEIDVRGDDSASIADIHPGLRVEIAASVAGGRIVAQIIRIR